MSDARGVDVRRTAIARFGAHASTLAVLTGFGLFFLAGLRDPESWGWFAFATLVGVLGTFWSIRSSLGAGVESAGAEGSEPGVARSEAPAPPRAATSTQARSDLDQVDYLMALRHEFRTPLNAVLGFSDVLLSGIDGDLNDSQSEDLEIIRASGIRLRILLDSALDLSKLSDGQLRLDAERTDIGELVARVSVEAGQLWSNKRIPRCALPKERCIADVDEARLRRSILVLADFLATDHRDADIALSLALTDDHVAIEVTANPSDHLALTALPTPADVLASEDATELRRWPLAVTSEVIAHHDGSLYHGDAPSRFLIRLPLGGAR